jgi:2-polyprenyl-3-methyl-5-hydroxy-6-metoxy-1,4-benzoquinol methylase
VDRYKETFDTWNKVAQLYQDKFMDLDLYNDSYDLFCQQAAIENASILEIGCGPGNITQYLLNKRPDFNIVGIDISPNMIELAKANNPIANFKVMDCRDIDQLQNRFDGIVCGFCIPYLSGVDGLKMIKDCADLLNNKGILYLSFVEGDYQQSGFQTASTGDRTYFYFYALESLVKELESSGFEINQVLKKKYERSNSTEVHTIIIASKHQ